MGSLSPRSTHFVVLDNGLFSDDDVYRPLHSVTQFKKIHRAHFWNEYIIQCKPKGVYLFGLLISCALYSRSSSDEKEILQGKTNRAYIFSNFVVIFICLTVSVHFLLSSMVFLYHVNDQQQGDDSHRLLWWGKKYNLYDLLHLQWAFSFTFLMFLWSNLAFRNYAMLNISYILFFLIMIPLQQSRTNYCRLTIGFENFRQRFKSKGEVLRMLCCVGVHRQLKSLSNNAI